MNLDNSETPPPLPASKPTTTKALLIILGLGLLMIWCAESLPLAEKLHSQLAPKDTVAPLFINFAYAFKFAPLLPLAILRILKWTKRATPASAQWLLYGLVASLLLNPLADLLAVSLTIKAVIGSGDLTP